MRKALFISIVALVMVAALIPATAASAGAARRVRYYEGPTSEGGRLRISVVVKDGVPYLNLLLIDGPYTCEDGTEGQIVDDGVGWFPRGPAITDAQIELSENWGGAVATMVSGHLGSLRGSGTLTFLIPTLTADEQAAQLCTFGGTWSVERTDALFSLKPTMTVEGAGGRTLATGFEVVGSPGSTRLAQTEPGPIRHYRGGTTQDRAMALRTSRADTGIALLSMAMRYSLACEDGAEVKGSIRPYFDTTQVVPPGRLDLDIVPTPDDLELGGVWLHLHGELDRHVGSGTVSMIWPRLTDDLGAQRCQTGDQDWRLWRTDAGY